MYSAVKLGQRSGSSATVAACAKEKVYGVTETWTSLDQFQVMAALSRSFVEIVVAVHFHLSRYGTP